MAEQIAIEHVGTFGGWDMNIEGDFLFGMNIEANLTFVKVQNGDVEPSIKQWDFDSVFVVVAWTLPSLLCPTN